MKLPIKNLKAFDDPEFEILYYTSEKMLSYGVYIEVATFENGIVELGTRGCLDTMINVHCCQGEGTTYGMYHGDYKNNFEVYIFIKELVELFNELPILGFEEALKELSESYYKNGQEINEKIIYLNCELWGAEI